MRWDEVKPNGKLKKFSEFAPQRRAQKLIEKVEEPQQLDEGRKVIKAGHEEIGIDKPHHPGQQEHAHLPNGRAVNRDGSISHGGDPFTMKRAWADALRKQNFDISKSRLVESEDGKVPVELDPALIEFLLELRKHLDNPG